MMNFPGFSLRLKLTLLVCIILRISLVAQVNPELVKDQHTCSIRFVRTEKTAITESASFMSREVFPLKPFQKILVVDADSTDWLEVVYPRQGFVNRNMLYTERQLEMLYRDILWKQGEFELVLSGKTPYLDLLEGESDLPSFDLARTWIKDDSYRVKIVNTPVLNVRSFPSYLFDTVGQFYQWDKIISDITFNRGGRWDKIVFPIAGFVNNGFLFTEEETQKRYDDQAKQLISFRDAVTALSIAEAEDKVDLRIGQKQSKETEVLKFESRDIIVRNNLRLLSDSSVTIWWTDRLDLNQNSFPGSSVINLQINDPATKGPFRTRLFYRKSNEENYHPLSMSRQKALKEGDHGTYIVGGDRYPLEQGIYNFRVEILDKKTRDLLAVQTGLDHEELTGLAFENEHVNHFYLDAMMTFSPVSVPMERGFSRSGFHYGTNIEVGRDDGRFSLGYGYNGMKAVSTSDDFKLAVLTNFLYVKWVPIRLFEDHLDIFLAGGPTAWTARIFEEELIWQKNPNPIDYQKGFSVMGGLGAVVNIWSFLFGVQYHVFGSPLVDFQTSADPYSIYTGSGQFQLLFGYRFHR